MSPNLKSVTLVGVLGLLCAPLRAAHTGLTKDQVRFGYISQGTRTGPLLIRLEMKVRFSILREDRKDTEKLYALLTRTYNASTRSPDFDLLKERRLSNEAFSHFTQEKTGQIYTIFSGGGSFRAKVVGGSIGSDYSDRRETSVSKNDLAADAENGELFRLFLTLEPLDTPTIAVTSNQRIRVAGLKGVWTGHDTELFEPESAPLDAHSTTALKKELGSRFEQYNLNMFRSKSRTAIALKSAQSEEFAPGLYLTDGIKLIRAIAPMTRKVSGAGANANVLTPLFSFNVGDDLFLYVKDFGATECCVGEDTVAWHLLRYDRASGRFVAVDRTDLALCTSNFI